MLASAAAMPGEVEHGGTLITKSAKAKSKGPVGCVYLTVTSRRPESWKHYPLFLMAIRNMAPGIKYGPSVVRFVPLGGFMAEIKLADEYGETYEACLVPGEYQIDAIGFGEEGIVFRPSFFEPIHLTLGEEDSLYLGNLYLDYPAEEKPAIVYVRDRLERDMPYLVKRGKHRLRNSIRPSLLAPGNNLVIVSEPRAN